MTKSEIAKLAKLARSVRINFVGRKAKPIYVTQGEAQFLYLANRIGHARPWGFFTATRNPTEIAAFLRDFRGEPRRTYSKRVEDR